MMPRSLDAVRRDDELLDRLGARDIAPRDVAGDDLVVALLAALAQDVDRDLPGDVSSIDSVAVEALAAAVSLRSRAAEAVAGPASVALVRELPRRRRVVAVRRGGAVVAGFALVVASAGVAAAVTGDPAGAFGVRAVSSIIDRVAHRHAAAPAATELERRLRDVERRPDVDPAVVATLEAQARQLPDQGGAEVQAALARLHQRLLSPTGGIRVTGGGGSGASPEGGQPSGHGSASAPGHERSAHPERTSPAHAPSSHAPSSHAPSSHASSSHASSSHAPSSHASSSHPANTHATRTQPTHTQPTHPANTRTTTPESQAKTSARPTTRGGDGAASGGSASVRGQRPSDAASTAGSGQGAGQGAGQGGRGSTSGQPG